MKRSKMKRKRTRDKSSDEELSLATIRKTNNRSDTNKKQNRTKLKKTVNGCDRYNKVSLKMSRKRANDCDSDDELSLASLKESKDANSYTSLVKGEKHCCEFCDKVFKNRYQSIIHNGKHIIIPLQKLTVYTCKTCLVCFTSKFKLHRHIRKIHPDLKNSQNPPTGTNIDKNGLKPDLDRLKPVKDGLTLTKNRLNEEKDVPTHSKEKLDTQICLQQSKKDPNSEKNLQKSPKKEIIEEKNDFTNSIDKTPMLKEIILNDSLLPSQRSIKLEKTIENTSPILQTSSQIQSRIKFEDDIAEGDITNIINRLNMQLSNTEHHPQIKEENSPITDNPNSIILDDTDTEDGGNSLTGDVENGANSMTDEEYLTDVKDLDLENEDLEWAMNNMDSIDSMDIDECKLFPTNEAFQNEFDHSQDIYSYFNNMNGETGFKARILFEDELKPFEAGSLNVPPLNRTVISSDSKNIMLENGNLATDNVSYAVLMHPRIVTCKFCGLLFPNRFTYIQHEPTHWKYQRKAIVYGVCRHCDCYVVGPHSVRLRHYQTCALKKKTTKKNKIEKKTCRLCHLKYYTFRHFIRYHRLPQIVKCHKCCKLFKTYQALTEHYCTAAELKPNTSTKVVPISALNKEIVNIIETIDSTTPEERSKYKHKIVCVNQLNCSGNILLRNDVIARVKDKIPRRCFKCGKDIYLYMIVQLKMRQSMKKQTNKEKLVKIRTKLKRMKFLNSCTKTKGCLKITGNEI